MEHTSARNNDNGGAHKKGGKETAAEDAVPGRGSAARGHVNDSDNEDKDRSSGPRSRGPPAQASK